MITANNAIIRTVTIEHIALWSRELDTLKDFYSQYFGFVAGEKYVNPKNGFSSYFLYSSDEGQPTGGRSSRARLELMHREVLSTEHNNKPQAYKQRDQDQHLGLAHIAFSLGSKEAVDKLTKQLKYDGYKIISAARTTGDGYYESCALDPENNRIEITI